MYLISIYVTVAFVVHFKASTSMLLPLLPPEPAKPKTDWTTTAPLNKDIFVFRMDKESYQAAPDSDFHKSAEKSMAINREKIFSQFSKFQSEQLSYNLGISHKTENNPKRTWKSISPKNLMSTDKMSVMENPQKRQISKPPPESVFNNQINDGTLLQTLFTTMIRNNRKKGVKKVLNRFIKNLQKIVDSEPVMHTTIEPVKHGNLERSSTVKKTDRSYEKTPNLIQDKKSSTRKGIDEKEKQSDNSQNVAQTSTRLTPVIRNFIEANSSTSERDHQKSNPVNAREQSRALFRKLDKKLNSASGIANRPTVSNRESVNLQTQNVETNAVKMGLTSNFDKLYRRLFVEQSQQKNKSRKSNIPYSGSHTKHSDKAMPNHSKGGESLTKKISDGHKTREMFRNLAEYTHNWNRQSSKESYDQFIHVEVINSPYYN